MKAFILALMLMFSVSGFAQAPKASGNAAQPAASSEQPVKKSKSGICHAPGSTYYSRTKNFTPFKTLDECLKSGGRLPKK